MMGLPGLPKKLPSRNWMIFWLVVGSFSAAVVYDKREKKRATARWSRAVAHLAREPIASPTQMPRRLTVFLESPPHDGLRVAQDHFTEYVKPVLAASGLDWEFVQGRREGDVRAAVAERIRRTRQSPGSDNKATANANSGTEAAQAQTQDEILRDVRVRNGTPEWQGAQGDIVIGRHTWKEYVRGLHEGWLGPLTAPILPESETKKKGQEGGTEDSNNNKTGEAGETEPKPEEEEKKKPERPPQPPPYNSPGDYPTSSLPIMIPGEFSPSTPVQFPHLLGFSGTLTRLRRFLNRRYLADDIGREVAAVCLATAREYRVGGGDGAATTTTTTAATNSEIETALDHEERDWPKAIWQDDKENTDGDSNSNSNDDNSNDKPPPPPPPQAEKIWARPMVVDPRIGARMRRFELRPEDADRAAVIVVPEEEVEGWIKGSLRGLWRWATARPEPRPNWADAE